jgi:iron(III) transport system permease protein
MAGSWRWLLVLAGLVLAWPVLGVVMSWLVFDEQAAAVLRHQWQTVLPQYVWQSLALALGVAVGTALVGVGAALAVALFQFPGRRVFQWTLLLPMAMPAYVLAYAYTDALQYSGPVQTWLRGLLGLRGALWPDVRSLWGAVALFVLCLYPYVYLLTLTALGERGATLLEAARLLGAGLWRRLWRVALPLARPAVVAGVALALMETLADYGVGAYFGLQTFSTGIYRAWLSMDQPRAAAQLASLLLACVAMLLVLERRAQARLRFHAGSRGGRASAESQPMRLRGGLAVLAFMLCAMPVLLGFVLPAGWLGTMWWREARYLEGGYRWDLFAQWCWTSLKLAALTAGLATVLALALVSAGRDPRGGAAGPLRGVTRALALGYAIPGAVIVVGLLLPLAWLREQGVTAPLGAWVTGSVGGLLIAYLVRFSAVALQTLEAGAARLPASLDESARLLGAGPWRTFWQVHLPLLRRSALAAGLLVFVDTLKELPATLVLRPFGSDTLAVVAFNLARDERLGEAALPALAIVAVGLLPVIVLARAMRPDRE